MWLFKDANKTSVTVKGTIVQKAFSSPGPLLPRRTESVRGENNNRHVQSNPVNKDTEEAMESICINEVSVLSRLNLEEM